MDEIEFIRSNKGGIKIIHKGYMYTVHKNKKSGGIRWRCANRRYNCKGSISTEVNGELPTLNMPHNHLPDLYSLALARQKRDEAAATATALDIPQFFDPLIAENKRLALSFVPELQQNYTNVWEPQTILGDSMPLQQRITKHSTSSDSQEPVLQSQPLSPTKLKVTRQAKTPAAAATLKVATPEPPNEEVCLRWNSHHANMQTCFPSLLLKEQYVDATLVAEGKTLKCHRMILSSCSTYFEEVLSGISPFQHPVVFMKDIPFWILKSLCDFMYAGEVHIYQNKLEELLSVAEVLKIKGLAGKTDTNEDVKPTIEPKKEEERSKEVKEEKKKEEKKKHQPVTPAPKEESLSKIATPKTIAPKVVTPKPSTSKASHNVRKPERAKEKEKTPIKKDENLVDPLDLLEPMYEEEVTKEPPKTSIPVKIQEKKSIPVRKPVSKKVKKRRFNEEREESPPPFLQQRKGTRSRPNVKIPKYFHTHFDPISKSSQESQDATIVREPHTTPISNDLLVQVEEIKAEPIDVEDDVIEIEDNVMSFSDQDLTSQDGDEEIIGNYDSPIVNIKNEKAAKESVPSFKPINLVAQPIILSVHSVSESSGVEVDAIATPVTSISNRTDGNSLVMKQSTSSMVSDILISNVQSVDENEVIDLHKDEDSDKSNESNKLAFKIESVISESTENKTVKSKAESVGEKSEESTKQDKRKDTKEQSSSENINIVSVEIIDDDVEIVDLEKSSSKETQPTTISAPQSVSKSSEGNNIQCPEVSTKEPEISREKEEGGSGFKGFKYEEIQVLQSDNVNLTSEKPSQNLEASSQLGSDNKACEENLKSGSAELVADSKNEFENDPVDDDSVEISKDDLRSVEDPDDANGDAEDSQSGDEKLVESSKEELENLKDLGEENVDKEIMSTENSDDNVAKTSTEDLYLNETNEDKASPVQTFTDDLDISDKNMGGEIVSKQKSDDIPIVTSTEDQVNVEKESISEDLDEDYVEMDSFLKPSSSSENPASSPEKTLEMIVNDLNESLKAGDVTADEEEAKVQEESGTIVSEEIENLWEEIEDRNNLKQQKVSDAKENNDVNQESDDFEKCMNEEIGSTNQETLSETLHDDEKKLDPEEGLKLNEQSDVSTTSQYVQEDCKNDDDNVPDDQETWCPPQDEEDYTKDSLEDHTLETEERLLRDDEAETEEQPNLRKRCRGQELDEEIRSLMLEQNQEIEVERECKKQKSNSPETDYTELESETLQKAWDTAGVSSSCMFSEIEEESKKTENVAMESSPNETSQEVLNTDVNDEELAHRIEETSVATADTTVREPKTEQGQMDDALREFYQKTIAERKLI